MKKVLTLLISFLLLFLLFDPINLESNEPNLALVKNELEEKQITLKLNNFNIKDLNKINLKIRELTNIKNGKEYKYTFKTNTNYENIINDYINFLQKENFQEDIEYSKTNGFTIDTITILDNYKNIKENLKNINYEVIKWPL